jgi:hypothetical protein
MGWQNSRCRATGVISGFKLGFEILKRAKKTAIVDGVMTGV